MPELPEVETVRRGLAQVMEGATITKAEIRRPDLRWPFPPDMGARLANAEILQLRRRSKYILIDLSTKETLLIHLGMSGRIQISGAPVGSFHLKHPAPEKHDHVVIDLNNGVRVTFNDARRFGAMDLLDTATAENHKLLASIGPEPLSNDFNVTYLFEKLTSKRSPIKSALLDQRIIAGLGNIYVCEVLFRTRIAPTKSANALTSREVNALVPAIRDVLSEAIDAGGSTLKDHRQADGDLGYFQHRFAVYGREHKSCPNDGCSSEIQRIVQSGRSTFYCPRCQR